jgi:hypothetical protein
MKRVFIFLILAGQAQATLTIDSGTYGGDVSTTSASTWAIGPAATIAASSMGVLIMALDNPDSAGAGKNLSSATITDSVGNTWTRRLDFIYDPGAANAGVEIGVYTGVLTTNLTSTGTVTITFTTAEAARAAAWIKVTTDTGNPIRYVAGGASCDGCTSGQSASPVTITTGTIAVGDVVFGFFGDEATSQTGSDTDTTNGTWFVTPYGFGSGGSMLIRGQWKIQTTADSTQTYNQAITAADWEAGWFQLADSVAPSPTPAPTAGPNTNFLPFLSPGQIWWKTYFEKRRHL